MSLIQKVRYDKSTTKMNPSEEKYWMHFLKGDPMIGDYIRSQMRHNKTLRRELFDQPVCPKCEHFTFFHKGGAMCPSCGQWTPENQTHSAKIHLADGHYK